MQMAQEQAIAAVRRTRHKVQCSSSGPVEIRRVVAESSSGPQREAVVGRRVEWLRRRGSQLCSDKENGNKSGSSTISASGRGDNAIKDGSDSSSRFVFSVFSVF